MTGQCERSVAIAIYGCHPHRRLEQIEDGDLADGARRTSANGRNFENTVISGRGGRFRGKTAASPIQFRFEMR